VFDTLAVFAAWSCLRRVTFFRKKVTKERKGLRALDPGVPVISYSLIVRYFVTLHSPASRGWLPLAQSAERFCFGRFVARGQSAAKQPWLSLWR